MKVRLSGGAVLALVALAAVGAVGYAVYAKKKTIGDAVGAAVDAVNPASDQNLAYRAANATTQWLTGDSGATIGTKLWEWLNPTQAATDVALTGPTPPKLPTAEALLSSLRDNDLAQFGLPPSPFNTTPGGAATGRTTLH